MSHRQARVEALLRALTVRFGSDYTLAWLAYGKPSGMELIRADDLTAAEEAVHRLLFPLPPGRPAHHNAYRPEEDFEIVTESDAPPPRRSTRPVRRGQLTSATPSPVPPGDAVHSS